MHRSFVRVSIRFVAVALVVLSTTAAHADEAQYKEHLKRARAHAALDQFAKAADEFLAAYKLQPKPALLFNAAHALWLAKLPDAALEQYKRYLDVQPTGSASDQARSRFFEAAEMKWQAKDTSGALALYQTYIDLAPAGASKNVATARRRFFEAAEILWENDMRDDAEPYYQRFIAFGGTGADVDTARARLQELQELRAREAEEKARADARAKQAIEDAHRDALVMTDVDDVRRDVGDDRTGYKIGFYSTAVLTVSGVVFTSVNVRQIRRAEVDKEEAIESLRQTTGDLNWGAGNDACSEAEADPSPQAEPIRDACNKGQAAATLANVGVGVTLVSLGAAAFLFYKAFVQKRGDQTDAVTLVPSISTDGVGARLLLRF